MAINGQDKKTQKGDHAETDGPGQPLYDTGEYLGRGQSYGREPFSPQKNNKQNQDGFKEARCTEANHGIPQVPRGYKPTGRLDERDCCKAYDQGLYFDLLCFQCICLKNPFLAQLNVADQQHCTSGRLHTQLYSYL